MPSEKLRWTALFFLFWALNGQAQRLNMNRMSLLGNDRVNVREGRNLTVSYRGMNTVNSLWVHDLGTDSTLAMADCMAREHVWLRLPHLPAGKYEVGVSGCWSGHLVLLHVAERRSDHP